MSQPPLAEVVLPIPIDHTFHYAMPSNGGSLPPPGYRVTVPFGQKNKTGVVVGYSHEFPKGIDRIKSIEAILDKELILGPEIIDLARWLARHYACSLGEAIFSFLPPARSKSRSTIQAKLESPAPSAGSHSNFLPLTNEQLKISEDLSAALKKAQYNVFLLWGVAAAGKTEIYMNAIREAVSKGGGVIYLVPEISLATQVGLELEARFPDLYVVWHSRVSASSKRQVWEDIKSGQRRIVLGARSAILCPMKAPSLIILDEEHDPSYKEDSKPRYHAREVALERARQSDACVILGSATPSLESYKAALDGQFQLRQLPSRVAGPATVVKIIDMKREKKKTSVPSESLRSALQERLKRREQSILFLNRRGFYTFCICPSCDWVFRCPSCDVVVIGHKRSKPKQGEEAAQLFRCHYCIYRAQPPKECPKCAHKSLWMGGTGTERVFSEIEKDFPWANVVRWDTDTAKKSGAHRMIFDSVQSKRADVVVGTKMVSQGLDLPGVTLVGIVDADVALHRPDFRAAERTFQLLVQASGRAGRRDVQGEVIIQTRQPDHPAILSSQRMDYPTFAKVELEHRKELHYPPYGRLLQLIFTGTRREKVEIESAEFSNWLKNQPFFQTLQILGPAPAYTERRAGKVRFQILVKGNFEGFDEVLAALKDYRSKGGVRVAMDVDPEELH